METATFYAFMVTVSLLSVGCIFAIHAILRQICDMILVIKEIKKEEMMRDRAKEKSNESRT